MQSEVSNEQAMCRDAVVQAMRGLGDYLESGNEDGLLALMAGATFVHYTITGAVPDMGSWEPVIGEFIRRQCQGDLRLPLSHRAPGCDLIIRTGHWGLETDQEDDLKLWASIWQAEVLPADTAQ